MIHRTQDISSTESGAALEFLWLELTNQCNLRCTHCYAESGPDRNIDDLLARSDYENLIREGRELGCKQIQFIGGEPTLNRDLGYFIQLAAENSYSSIEVFTNLISLSDELVECFVEYGVKVATSVYASDASIHDGITQVTGSFQKTIRNIEKLLCAGVPVRAGVIAMESNSKQVEATISYLKDIGVHNVGSDRLRHIGRGKDDSDNSSLTELCGSCAGNTLCVGPDGRVSPCIMSKCWSVGSVLETSLEEIATSDKIRNLRCEIHNAVIEPSKGDNSGLNGMEAVCTPKICAPYSSCSPKHGPGPCEPSGCSPCYPKG
ncbi:MAG: radical SAM protein [Nitrosomonas sp.]|nr:radical SAM protein [Nitrosomonas sp.]MCW5609051.1 radical SAM protein [Nitrosomonas sp.]